MPMLPLQTRRNRKLENCPQNPQGTLEPLRQKRPVQFNPLRFSQFRSRNRLSVAHYGAKQHAEQGQNRRTQKCRQHSVDVKARH